MSIDLKIMALALAVALQIQATLPLSQTGIRVSLADICLPVVLVVLLARRNFDPFLKLSWTLPRTSIWLAAITAIMTIALLTGYFRTGEWSSWALVNKYAGWFVLMAYFLLGGALTNLGGTALQNKFVAAFVLFTVAVSAINVLAMPVLFDYEDLPVGVMLSRATGFMQNPNAFALIIVIALALHLTSRQERKFDAAILLAGLWFAASRGAFLALVAMIAAFAVSAPIRLRPLLAGSLLAVGIIVAVTGLTFAYQHAKSAISEDASVRKIGHQTLGMIGQERYDQRHTTILERKSQGREAIGVISKSPFLGIGLGGYESKTGRPLHNSFLWLAVETGLLGASVFAGFFMAALWALYKNRDGPLQRGMFAVVLAFLAISMTGEFLYQRHLWFLLGMALVKHREETAAS